MAKPMIDPDALIAMFESATAKQGEQLRKAVTEVTLKALQSRELTLKNIRSALKAVGDAAGEGMAKNVVAGADVPGLLDKAVAGMDQALLRAVEANRTALSALVAQGADLRDKQLGRALEEMEKFEDTLMGVVKKMASGASQTASPLAAPWQQVLEKMQAGGTLSGAGAATSVEQLMEQAQAGIRSARGASLKAVQAMAESYAAMASGVLIGMSQALQHKAPAAPPPAPTPAPAAAKSSRSKKSA